MTRELELRRKWTLRVHGKQMVFFKKSLESDIHVLTKAFLWALFLPGYPDQSVEIRIGDRYKPDLVQTSENGVTVFWGEAGRVSQRKAHYLVNRFRSTHLVFAKWSMSLEPFYRMIIANCKVDISIFILYMSFYWMAPVGAWGRNSSGPICCCPSSDITRPDQFLFFA